jgi:hypothetical protein
MNLTPQFMLSKQDQQMFRQGQKNNTFGLRARDEIPTVEEIRKKNYLKTTPLLILSEELVL